MPGLTWLRPVLVMSNSRFGGIHGKLPDALGGTERAPKPLLTTVQLRR
jgi:hypothetical protein